METKVCTKCGEEKEASEFNKSSRNKSGLYASCKECRKQWRLKNRLSILEDKKQYYERNKDKILSKQKKYRAKNKDKLKQYFHEYYISNKEKKLKQSLNNRLKAIDLLDDIYIKVLLSNNLKLKHKDIPQWMIEAKRIEIIAHRLELKNKKLKQND